MCVFVSMFMFEAVTLRVFEGVLLFFENPLLGSEK